MNHRRASHRRASLTGVHLIGVHLSGVHLIGVHPMRASRLLNEKILDTEPQSRFSTCLYESLLNALGVEIRLPPT
jgi:hypothetical protein